MASVHDRGYAAGAKEGTAKSADERRESGCRFTKLTLGERAGVTPGGYVAASGNGLYFLDGTLIWKTWKRPPIFGSRCHHPAAPLRTWRPFLLIAWTRACRWLCDKSFAHNLGSLMSETMDPARMDEHVERMVKHLAVEVDATPEQKDKLTAIAKSAAHDLAPLRGNMKRARQQVIDLMSAEKVDRAAIENLRADSSRRWMPPRSV